MFRRKSLAFSSPVSSARGLGSIPTFLKRMSCESVYLPSAVSALARKLSPKSLSCMMRASMAAASRLWATPTAWMSPVRWRLKSSIGTTWV